MTFIGVISENKIFQNIKEHLCSKEISLIHISKKSIGNIKHIKFETIIIDANLKKFEQEKNTLEQICQKAKYLLINTDINIDFNLDIKKEIETINYGLNQKATVTISSIKDRNILIYLQKNIKNEEGKEIEVGERRLKISENCKLKTYEILIIYIINLVNKSNIIKEI
jgi:vacuolar-type H+-ATPase subunit I/STV1